MKTKIFHQQSDWVQAVLTEFDSATSNSIIALAGGSTPLPIYQQLNRFEPVYILTDERLYHNSQNTNQDCVPVPLKKLNLTQPDSEILHEADTIFQALLDQKLQPDLLLLGMGNDGHFASHFLESETILKGKYYDLVNVKNNEFPMRLSLNKKTLAQFKRKILVIADQQKYEIITNPNSPKTLPIIQFMDENPIKVYALLTNN